MIPDANRLREILCYDPETGSLTWRSRKRESFATLKSCNTWNTTQLGSFRSFDDAVAARRAAEVEMGFHPNHGRPRVAS